MKYVAEVDGIYKIVCFGCRALGLRRGVWLGKETTSAYLKLAAMEYTYVLSLFERFETAS